MEQQWKEGDRVWFEVPSLRTEPRAGHCSMAIVKKVFHGFGNEPVYAIVCDKPVCGETDWFVPQTNRQLFRGRPNRRVTKK